MGSENLSKLGKGSQKERHMRAQGVRSDQETLFHEVNPKKKLLQFRSVSLSWENGIFSFI